MIRNIIHGMDTVMSHITHFYHLSAQDFINFNNSVVDMSPWTPTYTAGGVLDGDTNPGASLILDYVEALTVRRLCHTAGALFSGRHPIQNAIVPGGVTTHFDATYPLDPAGPEQDQYGPYNATSTRAAFGNLLTTIRSFIDTKYIPDVLTVATHGPFMGFWTQSVGCANALAYGDFHMDAAGRLLLKRGVAASTATQGASVAFDQALIVEKVPYSHYDYAALDGINFPNGRHPYDGLTNPHLNKGGASYSWLKAPRYGASQDVYEVGPLARIWVSYIANDAGLTVTTSNGIPQIGLSNGASYSIPSLVGLVNTNVLSPNSLGPTDLFSTLGRHACRALEAKLLADACPVWLSLCTDSATCYDYKKIPKTITKGHGLSEAPRGALGHWIKIEGRKVAKYQCVVPSTWNFSPRDIGDNPGAVEQALESSWIGPDNDPEGQILNILRVVHPFDCCVACAVHVVGPDGKEKLRFAVDPDGRPANIKIADK